MFIKVIEFLCDGFFDGIVEFFFFNIVEVCLMDFDGKVFVCVFHDVSSSSEYSIKYEFLCVCFDELYIGVVCVYVVE